MKIETINQLEWLGHILKKLRKESRLTLKQVSEITGIPVSTINGYELGKVNPSVTKLMKLLECYRVHIIPLLLDGSEWIDARGVDEETLIKVKTLITKAKNLKKDNE